MTDRRSARRKQSNDRGLGNQGGRDMQSKLSSGRGLRPSLTLLLGSLAVAAAAGAPAYAGKDSVTVSVVQALAAGEWNTEILAGANAAAKDLNGKVKVRVTGPTTFDPQRQVQMFLAELETKPDVLIVVNVAPPLFTQPALEAQLRGANVVWINVPPMPEVKNALFVASDAFGMGQTGGAIVVEALEKSLGKPAAEIAGDVVAAVCVPGLTVLENRLAGEVSYLKKKMPKISVLASFDSKPDRERNFALWDQAIRKTPKALTYIDPCEEGEENIPKILENDKVQVPLVSYDSPEEVRDDVAQGLITATVPANFFSQAYLATYIAADALLKGKPLPAGWVKVPHVTVDKSNIAAYQQAWEKPETGLRAFYSTQIEATRDHLPATLPDPDLYTHPAQ
jgi:ribose transport system substrate-binding protein